MIQIKETVQGNELQLKGNMPDIVAYLEREAERCPKMSALQYVRLRRLERIESKQLGVADIRRGYENVLQR